MTPFGSPSLSPTPLSILSADFVQAFGRPAGLWLPCNGPEAKAYDLSQGELGGGNHGALNGGVTTTASGWGTLEQSWQFNGTSSQTIESPGQFPVASPMSLTIAFMPTSFATSPVWCGYGKDGFGAGWYAEIFTTTAGKVAFSVVVTTPSTAQLTVTSSASISANNWCIATGVWSPGNSLKIYVNGADSGTTATTSTVFRTSTIGFLISRSNVPAAGNVALGASWQSVFSAAQVSALYSSLTYGQPCRLFEPSVMERSYSATPLSVWQKAYCVADDSPFALIDEIFP